MSNANTNTAPTTLELEGIGALDAALDGEPKTKAKTSVTAKAPAKAKNGAPKRRVARPKKQKAAGAKAN